MGQATSPMKDLVNALSGKWSIAETYEDGTTDKGEEVWRTPPDKMQLIEEYHSVDTGSRDVYEFAVIWWDGKATKLRGLWCAAAFNDEGCSAFSVRRLGNRIEMTGQYEVRNKRFNWRETFTLATRTFTQILDIGPTGGTLKRAVTIRATKLSRD